MRLLREMSDEIESMKHRRAEMEAHLDRKKGNDEDELLKEPDELIKDVTGPLEARSQRRKASRGK